MQRFVPVVLLLVAAILPRSASGQQRDQAMQPLRRILGTWQVDDTYTPEQGTPIREVGTRTCAMVMRDSYVECVTHGRNVASGREREYRWLMNYNAIAGRYEIVGVFSNWPGKLRQTFRIDSTGSVWNIRAPSEISDGIERWSWAQLVFDGDDRATWTSYRNRETDGPATWQRSTVETWIRVPPRK